MQIRCEVKNPQAQLKPDMLARVRIITHPGSALVVPMESLVFDTNDYYVYVDLGGGRYDRRKEKQIKTVAGVVDVSGFGGLTKQ